MEGGALRADVSPCFDVLYTCVFNVSVVDRRGKQAAGDVGRCPR